MRRAPSHPGRAAGPLLGLAVACALATAALAALTIRTGVGQRLDDAARGGLWYHKEAGARSATETLLDTISVSSLALLGGAIIAIALLRRLPGIAIGAAVILLGANITTQLMKSAIGRPDLSGGGRGIDAGAFPSGHATVAMSLAMALVVVAPPALRWTAALGGCAYAAGVGVSVIALDWHRPSEVVGAYLVVVAWTAAVAGVLTLRGWTTGIRPGRAANLSAVAAAVVAAVLSAVVAVTAARRLDVEAIVDDRTAVVVAVLACVAACAALGAIATALVQRASTSPGRVSGG